ncbi:hypothetical protein ACYVV3_27995 (plasmid) [Escherichia coli]
MNISVEDLFPESFQRIKEEEEANRPDPNWFAHLPPEKINAYMSKYPFKSFDDIPLDNSGLQYPSLQELEFYFPPAALAANCHQLPERMRQKPVVTMINGLTLLRSLGVQAFNIDPRRWHKIAKWHLNRSQFGIRIDHDLASISDHSLASQSITIWHASDH